MREIEDRQTTEPQPIADQNFFSNFRAGLLHYHLWSLIVVLGVALGHEYLKPQRPREGGLLDAFANWDGRHYREIAETGYAYNPDTSSNVAFFPAFPLLGGLVSHLSGWTGTEALLLVSQTRPWKMAVLPQTVNLDVEPVDQKANQEEAAEEYAADDGQPDE